MNESHAKEFLHACNEVFGFLVRDHGFQPAVLEVDHQIHFATVSFMGKHVAVECIFDEREVWVEVKIARVVNGTRPTDDSIDGAGRRVRAHLYTWLIDRGVRSFGPAIQGLSKKPLGEMFRSRLSKDADLLRRHGSDVLGDSPTVL